MKGLRAMAAELCRHPPPGLKLRLTPEGLEAFHEATDRWQEVHFEVEGEHAILTSPVLSRDVVTADVARWRELALAVWDRNRLTDVVRFTFDKDDNLVGRVVHPRATLDLPELRLYVGALLENCDRFEYVLTGEDVN